MSAIIFKNTEYCGDNFDKLDYSGQMCEARYFYDCLFRQCDFTETLFRCCKFNECEFVDCNLSLVKPPESSFKDVRFIKCKMLGINWTSANWPSIKMLNSLSFEDCILNDCSFFGLYLAEVKMIECRIHEADFTEADCTEADFKLSDFLYSTFHNTNLMGADFTDSVNYNINIFHNNIRHAKFILPEAVSLLNSLDIELSE